MKRTQIAALVFVVLLVGVVVGMKVNKGAPARDATTVATGATCPTLPSKGGDTTSVPAPVTAPAAQGQAAGLPRLVDLGSTTCIPCKQMAPILEQLKTELQGKVDVEFIDITIDAKAADQYAINVIPTQIMLDGQGKELFRHEGFFPKADILAKLRELKLLAEG